MFVIGNSTGNHAVRITVRPDFGKEYTVDILTDSTVEDVEKEVESFIDSNLRNVHYHSFEIIG